MSSFDDRPDRAAGEGTDDGEPRPVSEDAEGVEDAAGDDVSLELDPTEEEEDVPVEDAEGVEDAAGDDVSLELDPTADEEDVPVEELARFLSEKTSGGLFPAITHGLDPRGAPGTVAVATSPINDLPAARSIVEKVHGENIYPYRFVPLNSLEYIAKTNRTIGFHKRDIPGFRADLPAHRRALGKLMHFCTASHWEEKAFLLVDVVGFSKMSSAEQLAMRLSLGQAINQCEQRMYRLRQAEAIADSRFNRISTGDGFYLWSYVNGIEGHIATFVMLVLLMTQARDLEQNHGVPLELTASYGIGEAFVFPYDGASIPPLHQLARGFRPDAIGPVLNDLKRLLTAAFPSQILVSPFDLPGREDRAGERLDVQTMLTIVRQEVLPQELGPTDAIKPHDIHLRSDPDTNYRVVDKHRKVHHCCNVVGTIPSREKGNVTSTQAIGVLPDPSPTLDESGFVRG